MTTEAPPAELTFETDFTRHIFSLFASLYDSRASPYLGPIPPPEGEESALDDDAAPPLDTSLCDFRLRLSYTNEVDARPNVLDELAAKGEAIVIAAADPKALTPIILGDRLPARTVTGKPLDADFQTRRKEALLKTRKVADKRRKAAIDERRLATMKTAQSSLAERQEILRQLQEIRRAEKEQREGSPSLIWAWSQDRKKAMLERRKHLDERRALEWQQVEDARRSVQNVSYHSQRSPDRVRSPRKEEREVSARETRSQVGKAHRQYNEENIKPTKSLRTSPRLPA
jgi:hypothetical protein